MYTGAVFDTVQHVTDELFVCRLQAVITLEVEGVEVGLVTFRQQYPHIAGDAGRQAAVHRHNNTLKPRVERRPVHHHIAGRGLDDVFHHRPQLHPPFFRLFEAEDEQVGPGFTRDVEDAA